MIELYKTKDLQKSLGENTLLLVQAKVNDLITAEQWEDFIKL